MAAKIKRLTRPSLPRKLKVNGLDMAFILTEKGPGAKDAIERHAKAEAGNRNAVAIVRIKDRPIYHLFVNRAFDQPGGFSGF